MKKLLYFFIPVMLIISCIKGPEDISIEDSSISIDDYINSLTPTPVSTPDNETEILISKAIKKAVIEDKNIPGYPILRSKEKIIVSDLVIFSKDSLNNKSFTLSSGVIPESDTVKFILLSPEEIQNMADEYGDYLYIIITNVVVGNLEGELSISLVWAVGRNSKMMYLSGGGYRLQYIKSNGNWEYDKTINWWQS